MESGLSFTIDSVRAFSGVPVLVVLADGTTHRGRFRTDLLSDRSVSVYIAGDGDEGATLYIDQIAEIVPLSTISVP
jgi:hypothetical protein